MEAMSKAYVVVCVGCLAVVVTGGEVSFVVVAGEELPLPGLTVIGGVVSMVISSLLALLWVRWGCESITRQRNLRDLCTE